VPPTPTRAKASYSELSIRLAPDTKFEEIVKVLEQVLTLPKLPGFGGCQPCFSGLDRAVFENPAIRQFQR
jgi:hypothetical protein